MLIWMGCYRLYGMILGSCLSEVAVGSLYLFEDIV